MILSALLSALTGAFAGTRTAEARLNQPAATRSFVAAQPVATVALPVTRPAETIPPQPRRIAPVPVPPAPLASAPIETDRLLE